MKDQTNKVASQKEYKNHDPIILVHGFNGYASGTGPITGKGNYWGGDRLKIIQDYRAKGYNAVMIEFKYLKKGEENKLAEKREEAKKRKLRVM